MKRVVLSLAAILSMIVAVRACRSGLDEAFPSFVLRAEMVRDDGSLAIHDGHIFLKNVAKPTALASCTGTRTGTRLVVSRGKRYHVFACGEEFQVRVGFVVDGALVETFDACDLGRPTSKLTPFEGRPWRDPRVYSRDFSPFKVLGPCG
jgi:hypothetical protein